MMAGMLGAPGRSKKIAYSSIFAVAYSIARLFPISPYVGLNSTLTFGEIFSPLAGMLFGPYVGVVSVTLGTFLAFIRGRPPVFDGLDFLPGATAALVAGFCFTGKRNASLLVPLIVMALFTIDPLSMSLISVGPISVPFLWMHLLSVLTMGVTWVLVGRKKIQVSSLLFVGATFFLSTMSAHVAGGVMFENVLVRINGVLPSNLLSYWRGIFYLYPLERTFFTIAGTAVTFPILRTISRWTGKV